MSVGQMFLDKCLDTNVVTDPWPHQIITKTFDDKVFDKLQNQCVPHLNVKTTDIIQIHPKEFKDYNIDFYDETVDICEKLLKNVKQLHDVYPAYRKYPTLGVMHILASHHPYLINFIYTKKVLRKPGVR